ncbi:hypothetical protein [Azospirillum brasilense]|uniref:hypothetical protein n=1 Tax=Azospirillum brasilense TaxID=192 RepID=UPI000E6A27F3|nr:hypothetical protein [Azospirillum brasilense]NUB24268.1 hypothetical protein [Azospirillum brasilense]NUB30122.1 hypothetical protein [Azospirillum brasilense]RIW04977.1 hypothetical protein D2T81_09105 [Azospirillum brasilense]
MTEATLPKLATIQGRGKNAHRVRITDQHVDAIRNIIERWPRPITWNEIIAESAKHLGHTWTRQALERHEAIKAAYAAKRDARPEPCPIDPAVALLTQQVERQVQEIGRLERLVESYKDLFIRYQYNAYARGITPAELEMPLPPIDRRRSES